MKNRLSSACVVIACLALPPCIAHADPVVDNWTSYAGKFVQQDGRVVDTGAKFMSHSESQGTAMLLAEKANDRASFDKIWAWTRANLGTRKDDLFVWGWYPDKRNHKPDINNATDGDLLIAWALEDASERWNVPEYRKAATAIAKSLRLHMLRDTVAGPVLLPGGKGFESKKGIVINLSYMVLPAYAPMNKIDPDPTWQRLSDTAHVLFTAARAGRFSLPTDWSLIAKPAKATKPARRKGKTAEPQVAAAPAAPAKLEIVPWPDKPARFGYEAIRIPLYLAWSGADGQELWPFQQYWRYFDTAPFHPAWVDVKEDTLTFDNMPKGFLAVRHLADEASKPTAAHVDMPSVADEPDYYSASLIALSALALQERQPK